MEKNNFGTIVPISTASDSKWIGSESKKFKGERFHKNHPKDQLDHLLIGNLQLLYSTGKKQYQRKMTIDDVQTYKPVLKIFPQKHYPNRIFEIKDQKKLINLGKEEQNDEYKIKNKLKAIAQKSSWGIGTSKIKGLQTGAKQTGIYRNFYKSQTHSQTTFLQSKH